AEKIDEVQPTEGSFAFYLGKDTGEILPTRSFDQVNSALEADDGRLAAALERMKRGETAVERIQINGEPHFVAYAPFGPIGGSLAVAAPVSEITARAAAITASIDE